MRKVIAPGGPLTLTAALIAAAAATSYGVPEEQLVLTSDEHVDEYVMRGGPGA
jgi:hypothetical protein